MNPLEGFPVTIEVPVAWGEMDAFGHVNNIVYFRYFESARIAYFERVGFTDEMERSGIGPILASTRCRFRKPLTYPDTIHVGASARNVEDDRFVMVYAIVSQTLGALVADGEGVVVAYDYRAGRKARLPDSVREALAALEPAANVD